MSTETIAAPVENIEKQGKAAVPAYAWVVLGIVMLAGVTAPLNQFKVPPVMPVIMANFRLDLTSAGLLMSIFAITGLALALPAGIIFQKLGARMTGLIALGCLGGGAALGALSASASLLLFSRLVEGTGMGLIAVTAPAAIAAWFPPERRGLPMGVWATWVSLGSLIIYNLAPALNGLGGWRAVWWAGAIFALAAFSLYALWMRMPPAAERSAASSVPAPASLKQVLANRDLWLLALSFGCFNLVIIGVIATYYPTFLTTVQGFSLANASLITSLKMIVVIATAPLAGAAADRLGSPKRIILVAFSCLAVFMLFPFSVSGWGPAVCMALLGILAGSIPMATFASVPDVLRKGQAAGIGMAVIMIGQNLGQLIGPLVFSKLVASAGWASAGYWMIPVVLVGIAATWLTRMR